VTATLGIACDLASWKIVGISIALALFLLAGLGWIERVYGPDDEAR
jgi:hypothetical protein